MTTNINLETGIAFGYISALALHSDTVDSLLYGHGSEFTDHSWDDFVKEYRAENALSEDDELPDNLGEYFDSDESSVSGVYQGVHYASSWLGGALNFFIFQSPHITDSARMASPCVPNAGILDELDGSVQSYDVPNSWRYFEGD